MKRPDGAYFTLGELEETITRLRVQLDNANERIMKLEQSASRLGPVEHVEYPSQLPDDYLA